MTNSLAEVKTLYADLQEKLSLLSESDLLKVAYKAGLIQSEFVRPVCDYLDDWILETASAHASLYLDLAFLNLKNVQKSIILAGF